MYTIVASSVQSKQQLNRVQRAAYAVALAVSISTWLVAIRAPLWLDETISLFLIKDGFRGITRQMWPDAPAYSYLLLLWTKVIGELRDGVENLLHPSYAGRGGPAVLFGKKAVRAGSRPHGYDPFLY